jgi:hypothetical protein
MLSLRRSAVTMTASSVEFDSALEESPAADAGSAAQMAAAKNVISFRALGAAYLLRICIPTYY